MLVKLISPVGIRAKINGKVLSVPGIYEISDVSKIPSTIRYQVNRKTTKIKVKNNNG